MKIICVILLLLMWTHIALAQRPQAPAKIGLVPYTQYKPLTGEDESGNAFVFRYGGRLFAAMSRHQFPDWFAPSKVEDAAGSPVLLDRSKVFLQEDVQIVLLEPQNAPVQFMEFNPVYELKAGERLWVGRGTDRRFVGGTFGKLRDKNLEDGKLSSTNKPVRLFMELASLADLGRASGTPVVQVATGKPVGVMLDVEIGTPARAIIFEPICWASARPAAAESPQSNLAGKRVAVDIRQGAALINGKRITRETRLSEYEAFLGKPDRVKQGKNTIHTYDDLGILLYQRPGESTVSDITLVLMKAGYDFSPRKTFQGTLKVAGQVLHSELPRPAIRNLKGVRIDPATAAPNLPFIELTQGNIILSLTYMSSTNRLGDVGITWKSKDSKGSNSTLPAR
jgi:hypothetical protein